MLEASSNWERPKVFIVFGKEEEILLLPWSYYYQNLSQFLSSFYENKFKIVEEVTDTPDVQILMQRHRKYKKARKYDTS